MGMVIWSHRKRLQVLVALVALPTESNRRDQTRDHEPATIMDVAAYLPFDHARQAGSLR